MKSLGLSTLLSFASLAYAQTSQYCPGNSICYSVNIPASTASSGSGDIFFQITGPTSAQWIGLGQGSRMSGSQIFVIYASSDGTNVTLSPRLGQAQFEPSYNSGAKVSLLAGSGISGSKMTANIRCSSCTSWSGGSMKVTSTSAPFIWAYKSGSAINSDSPSVSIAQHDQSGQSFAFDLTKATGGSSTNPFVTSSSSTGSSSSGTSSASGSSSTSDDSSSSSGSSSSGSSSSSSGAVAFGPSPKTLTSVRNAHCLIMAVTFLILFPVGALFMRLLSFPGLVWLHASWQTFSLLASFAGLGLGAWYIRQTGQPWKSQPHFILGSVIMGMLVFQPFVGLAHHTLFRKTGGRTSVSYIHIWYGRIIFILAIVNGGIGLQLTQKLFGKQPAIRILYPVVAALIGLVYIVCVLLFERNRRTRKTVPEANGLMSSGDHMELARDNGGENGGGYGREYGREHGRVHGREKPIYR